tara:strand:+ start:64 stop:243 length:180 start_codon:yes stop_codon:yes gene_type:complete
MKYIKVTDSNNEELKHIAPGTILKVNENAAERLINDGHAVYVPSDQWRAQEDNLNEKEK